MMMEINQIVPRQALIDLVPSFLLLVFCFELWDGKVVELILSHLK